MAINYDGVYEVRMKYTTISGTVTLEHRHTVDVNLADDYAPGTLFTDIEVTQHDGGTELLAVEFGVYLNLIKPFFHTSTDFTLVELWKYPEEGMDAVFISVNELGELGTSAVVTGAAMQSTMTHRTLAGGVMRSQFMETTGASDAWLSYPFAAGAIATFGAYMQGTNHGWVGRDNTRPIVPIRWSATQNEKLYRKRFRP